MAGYASLFSKGAAEYSLYRPQYTKALFDKIYSFAKLNTHSTVLDIATGTGQAAVALAEKFDKVIAIDSNNEQIAHFPALPNAEVRVADAHNTGVPDSSIDLVTVAQALHWMELPPFYKEVVRVLKPPGAFAAWGYDLLEIVDQPAAQAVLVNLYDGILGPYWAERRRLVEKHYEGMEPSNGQFGEVERAKIIMPSQMTIQQLGGYVSSWSSYNTYRSQHPDRPDPLPPFKSHLQQALGAQGEDAPVSVNWTLFIILARNPRKA